MKNNWVCVDANLVVRLVADPDDRATWQLWQSWFAVRQPIMAPTLLFYEVSNALYQYHRVQSMSAETIREALDTALTLPIHLRATDDMHSDALRLAERYGLRAAYDAHYLALAERLGAEFWTADRRLAQQVAGELPWVRLLDTSKSS